MDLLVWQLSVLWWTSIFSKIGLSSCHGSLSGQDISSAPLYEVAYELSDERYLGVENCHLR